MMKKLFIYIHQCLSSDWVYLYTNALKLFHGKRDVLFVEKLVLIIDC